MSYAESQQTALAQEIVGLVTGLSSHLPKFSRTLGMCVLYVSDKNGVLTGWASFFFLHVYVSLKCIRLISSLSISFL